MLGHHEGHDHDVEEEEEDVGEAGARGFPDGGQAGAAEGMLAYTVQCTYRVTDGRTERKESLTCRYV